MLYFNDYLYEKTEITHTRQIVRAVLLDESNNVILEHLVRNDDFGYGDYLETPGGGIDINEDHATALKRELIEELGLNIEVICYIDSVHDYYNLIKRCNETHYYLCKVIDKCDSAPEELEKQIIVGTYVLSIDESIKKMEENVGNLGKLVLQRELPILKKTKEILKEKQICIK